MPVIYLSKEVYDELVRMGEDPGQFAVRAIQEKLAAIKSKEHLRNALET